MFDKSAFKKWFQVIDSSVIFFGATSNGVGLFIDFWQEGWIQGIFCVDQSLRSGIELLVLVFSYKTIRSLFVEAYL